MAIGHHVDNRRHLTVPNFVKIGQSFAEILRFFDFLKITGKPILYFAIAKLFYG